MRLFREPLFHFLLLGAAIFALSHFSSSSTVAPTGGLNDHRIVIPAQQVALLRNGYVLDNNRPPTDAELQHLIDAYVREEILVREARAQGLDRDDTIIRRRLVQKMDFAVADPPTPPDSELESYLAQHPATFRTAAGTVPALADIHPAVLSAWMADQRQQAADQMYQKYRAQYQVSVVPIPTTQPSEGAK